MSNDKDHTEGSFAVNIRDLDAMDAARMEYAVHALGYVQHARNRMSRAAEDPTNSEGTRFAAAAVVPVLEGIEAAVSRDIAELGGVTIPDGAVVDVDQITAANG